MKGGEAGAYYREELNGDALVMSVEALRCALVRFCNNCLVLASACWSWSAGLFQGLESVNKGAR